MDPTEWVVANNMQQKEEAHSGSEKESRFSFYCCLIRSQLMNLRILNRIGE